MYIKVIQCTYIKVQGVMHIKSAFSQILYSSLACGACSLRVFSCLDHPTAPEWTPAVCEGETIVVHKYKNTREIEERLSTSAPVSPCTFH